MTNLFFNSLIFLFLMSVIGMIVIEYIDADTLKGILLWLVLSAYITVLSIIITLQTEKFREKLTTSMKTKIIEDSSGNLNFKIIVYNSILSEKKHVREISASEVKEVDSHIYGEEIKLENHNIIILKLINNTDNISDKIIVKKI